jgi:peptide/nickel transport system permease protein
MYDPIPPDTWWQTALVVAKHMILPVAAILLTLFLQCVAAWRAFFQIYATEDYIELAVAKGLAPRTIERRYLLRSTLPYIITSFSLTLLGFWQMTTALEYFFDWPGIGEAYVEAITTGDVVVAVGVVVIFAYLLGLFAVVLDLLYTIVDPRIRLAESGQNVRLAAPHLARRPPAARRVSLPAAASSLRSLWRNRRDATPPVIGLSLPKVGWTLRDGWDAARRAVSNVATFSRHLLRAPSAVVGLAIIALLVAMSGYALAAVPRSASIADRVVGPDEIPPPHNAQPVWVNWFRSQKLPATLTLDSRSGQAKKETQASQGTAKSIRLIFTFDYSGYPKDLLLRFYTGGSSVFVVPRWFTPDGREIAFKARSVNSGSAYDISDSIPQRYLRSHALYDQLRTSGSTAGQGGLPRYATLFTDPTTKATGNLSGRYSLVLDGQAFEADADLDARLTLIGQVSGWAGTDDSGNDLWAGLLWGAPAALVMGLAGAAITTLVSLLLAAAGAWFGGAWDGLIQRLTEVTMVLPVLAIAVLLQRLFGFSLWLVMGTVVLVSALGTPLKSYRAAFLQVKEGAYIESARAYGAGNRRIILRYMIPPIAPMIAPQLAILVPGFVFLEATLAIFGVSGGLPTWGNLIYSAMKAEIWHGNYWALIEPLFLCVLTGLGFALLASALERVLNPRLRIS